MEISYEGWLKLLDEKIEKKPIKPFNPAQRLKFKEWLNELDEEIKKYGVTCNKVTKFKNLDIKSNALEKELIDKLMNEAFSFYMTFFKRDQSVEFHNSFIKNLKRFLEIEGFKTKLEHKLNFNYYSKKRNSYIMRSGKIDLCAFKMNLSLALEFDSHSTLKNKSIEKLIESNCDICIGIAIGITNQNTSKEYYSKILKNLLINDNFSKSFWLLILSEKSIEKII